jgi:DNA-binding IclR family transcriptional regulator
VSSSYWVPMVGNAFKVLEVLQGADAQLTLQGVSQFGSISKTSAFRILFTLDKLGYVQRNPVTGKYCLGLKITELAQRVLSGCRLVPVAHPHLVRLRDQFDETVNLAILQDGELVYVEILESNHVFRMVGAVGSRVPIHSTALGKAIAAFLPKDALRSMLKSVQFTKITPHTIIGQRAFLEALGRVRKQGYSVDREETEPGAWCLAVPILKASHIALAAISASGPRQRIQRKQMQIVRALKESASQISQYLTEGYQASMGVRQANVSTRTLARK